LQFLSDKEKTRMNPEIEVIEQSRVETGPSRTRPGPIDDPPLCVYCKRGTTPARLVTAWISQRANRRYHAHEACHGRNRGKPIPPDPLVNRRRLIPSLADRLSEWNALADDLDHLLAQCRSAPRAVAVMKIACNVANAVSWRVTGMTEALADPYPAIPDEAGDQVRILRWHVEKLRAALEGGPSRDGWRGVCNIETLNLRLPETVGAVREAYEREFFCESDEESDELIPQQERQP
jgi:hypothetical protein